jgi:uncharacterized protein YvpB
MTFMKVPLFKQTPNSCGITSLRMVFSYFGKDVSDKEIIKGVGGLKKYGVRTVQLADYARSKGFKAVTYSFNRKLADSKTVIKNPEVKDITTFLNKKIPVIINIRYSLLHGTRMTKAGHYIVITAFKNNFFTYNDPDDGKEHRIDPEKLRLAWFANVFDSSAYLLAIWPK